MLHSIVFDAVEIRKENREHARANAAYAAKLLEEDRQAVLYADLMRQRRQLREQLEMVERRLEDFDVLRILETAS